MPQMQTDPLPAVEMVVGQKVKCASRSHQRPSLTLPASGREPDEEIGEAASEREPEEEFGAAATGEPEVEIGSPAIGSGGRRKE